MRLLTGLLAALALTGCQEQREPVFDGPDVDAIRAQHAGLAAAINARDLEESNGFYDLSHMIVEPMQQQGGVSVTIQLDNRTLIEDPNGAIQYQHINVEVSGDVAMSEGECIITRTHRATGQAQPWVGHCMHVWRRGEDGAWRIARENRNLAPRNF